jgi:hypothetical protein
MANIIHNKNYNNSLTRDGFKMTDATIVSFAVFQKALENRNKQQDTAAPRPLKAEFEKTFVAFNADEQQEIIALHQKFSGVSRDYSFSHEESAAMITLLACALTREALVVFEKRVNDGDENAPYIYAAYNFDKDTPVDIESTDIKDVAAAAAPYLSKAQDAQYERNQARAAQNTRTAEVQRRRAAFGVV